MIFKPENNRFLQSIEEYWLNEMVLRRDLNESQDSTLNTWPCGNNNGKASLPLPISRLVQIHSIEPVFLFAPQELVVL